jgi:hypothetical protein
MRLKNTDRSMSVTEGGLDESMSPRKVDIDIVDEVPQQKQRPKSVKPGGRGGFKGRITTVLN